MPDCPYCERSFADESEIRKHLYEDHESDELGRIDTKRVEQYIDITTSKKATMPLVRSKTQRKR